MLIDGAPVYEEIPKHHCIGRPTCAELGICENAQFVHPVRRLIVKEVAELTKEKQRLIKLLPHSCCDCAKRNLPCLEPDGTCCSDYCAICKPHMDYVESVLEPRIEQLQDLKKLYN